MQVYDINLPFNCVLKGNNLDSITLDDYRNKFYKCDKQLISNDNTIQIRNISNIESLVSWGDLT